MFAVEKLITSKLHEPKSNRRIFTIDKHIGMVCDYNNDTCKGYTLKSVHIHDDLKIMM